MRAHKWIMSLMVIDYGKLSAHCTRCSYTIGLFIFMLPKAFLLVQMKTAAAPWYGTSITTYEICFTEWEPKSYQKRKTTKNVFMPNIFLL